MLQPHHAFAAAHHRRNPSAPTLSVQPTGTRGLLALAKPKPQAVAKLPPSHKSAPRLARSSAPPAAHTTTSAAVPSSDPVQSAVAAAVSESADQPQRGRKQKPSTTPSKPARRAASQQPVSRRPREHHQPDPEPTKTPEPNVAAADEPLSSPASSTDAPKPQTPPPQSSAKAEAQSPRKRPAQHQRHNTAPPSPLAANASPAVQQPSVGQPSGRLARNRRQRLKSTVDEQNPPTLTIDSPAPSTPIPVPTKRARSPAPISRSAPLEHSAGLLPFPIMTDQALSDWDLPAKLEAAAAAAAAAANHDGDMEAPHWLLSGPRTAPLGKSPRFPNYSPPPTPTPASRTAKQAAGHARSPSYPTGAMFAMSLDDEPAIIAGTRSADVSPFRLARQRINQPVAVTFPEWSKFKASTPKDKNAPMWAASAFQTGPRDLPAPGL
ncbi:hypothetical protein AURDEDRAFT_111779 [Auricularia subglabra TFB-10046 SS5]|nr:hypothetical protein AURDEDRAFT_111779 [Auricularia subglabra TFB-10046 SS5]